MVNKITDLLQLARRNGIFISIDNHQLSIKYSKENSINSNLLQQIKDNKDLIIDFLNNKKSRLRKIDSTENEIRHIVKDPTQHIPVSFSQERIWFIDRLEGSIHYHIPIVRRLKGALNKKALAHALQDIVNRHEVLRTVILEQEGEPYQFVNDSINWHLEILDVSSYLYNPEALQERIQHLILKPFDLAKDYMIRAHLLSLTDDEYVLIVTMHHIASDGWSKFIFVKELMEVYNAYLEQRPANLAPLAIQYADYSLWQRNYLQGEVLDKKVEYWKDKLKGVAVLQLPTDHQRPAEWSSPGALLKFSINKLLSDQLQALSRQEGTTLFMTLLAAFKVLLHRHSGQEDICVGSPIANRTQKEVEGLIGFFVNTLALRSEVRSELSFKELLQQIKGTAMEAFEHQDVPFEKIVEAVVKERDLSRNPLFQVMLVMQNTPAVQALRIGEVQLSDEEFIHNTTHFDITFSIAETLNGLEGVVEYATDLYNKETILRMPDHFTTLLASIVRSPLQKIGELRMLTNEEEHQLLVEFNDTKVDYPKDKTIVDLFEVQSAKTPDANAVVFEEEHLTYKELNERANQLAHYLRSMGVKEETLVPICIERSLEMIIGILGILKSGGAYVPIDPEYPEDRINFMLEDSNAKVVLTSSKSCQKLPAVKDLTIIELDSQWVNINEQPVDNLPVIATADNLAYVIYTSGSTGKPKGVMNEHGGLMNRLCWAQDYYGLTIWDSVLQKTTYCFDVSVWELLWPLMVGSRLVFARPDGHKDTAYLRSIIDSENITMLHFVPSMLEVFLFDLKIGECKGLRKVLCSGEALKLKQVELFTEKLPHAELHNLYGPTEAAIDVTYWSIPGGQEIIDMVPIGKPVSNTQIYILGGNNELMPVGVPGEINIGGIQVSRGYLNRPELTQEKFIKDPFIKEGNARIYKTGDLGRWLADGNIEYLGRRDDQVKIRGYRIELGEIESVLQQCEGVSQGVVLAREDGNDNKRLVGYVVPEGVFNKEAVISYLKSRLPEYMVPTIWVELNVLPLTSNGKIDRKTLPDPDVSEQMSDQYTAPRNDLEIKLADIWKNLLAIERVGIYQNFFDVGGHSLLAMRIISAIRKELLVELAIKDIFQYTTINDLSEHIKSKYQFEYEADKDSLNHSVNNKESRLNNASFINQIVQADRDQTQYIPLSFSQERLWFIDQLEGSIQYHSPAAWRLNGPLNKEALFLALKGLINRHEVLRTVFLQEEGKAYQSIRDTGRWQLEIINDSNYYKDQDGLKKYIQGLISKPFDLSKDYMLRAHLVTLSDQENILIVTIHHIASDGWSTSILVKELMELYNANAEDRLPQLPLLPIQYTDYAIWQRNYLQGEILDKRLRYWKDKLDGVAILQLPSDYHRSNEWSNRGAWLEFKIDKLLSNELQTLSRQEGITLFMTLLTAFNVLLHRYSGQEDICVGSPIANRTHKEIEGLIGFFVNTLALRSEVKSGSSFTELLQQIKATTMEAYEYQDVPFEKVVEVVVKERDMNRNPLFQVMMVLQNTPKVDTVSLGEAQLSVEEFEHDTAQFDITFFIAETAEGLRCSINYSIDLYKEATIIRMGDHFKTLLSSIVKNPQQKIGELKMLTEKEEHQLLYDFNDTVVDYPKDKTIVGLFEEQAIKMPEAIAVVFEEEQLTYRDLNERANQLAHYLRRKGIEKETLVPICIERGLDMVIGILGILKAGGAFVPIDPEYPQERISYMLENTEATNILISKKSRSKILSATSLNIVEIDSEWLKISNEPIVNLQTDTQSHHLAYVIFTSGSTGKPKGVMIEHRSVVNFLMSMANDVQFASDSSILSVTTFSFDICYLEFFLPLICGGKLFIVSREVAVDGFKLAENISDYCPTHMQATPSTWQLLLECEWENKESIIIMIGGEAVKETLKDKLTKIGRVFNLYGPTETTIWSAIKKLDDNHKVSIGKPIANTSIYIVNDQQQLCPVTIAGEIYIGGGGLSRGYLNHPELTAEKFINHPFCKGERVYKTGDLGKWLPDGNIEYIRRKDDQVKIRGYRIELGEIESALLKSKLVNQATVLVREDKENNKRLVGYYIPTLQVIKAKEHELSANKVNSWQEVYEAEYTNTETGVEEEFDIDIWKDSFTGEPIPAEHMREWLADIVQIILNEKPEHVLEIGTGSGLIYYQLAGKVKKYIGTDFSTSSINRIRENIKKGLKDYGPTELKVCAAHEVLLEKDEQVDTIILNSIIQYFPCEDYMNEVVGKSISLLKGKGRIIIGDVRDNRLLGLFKARLRIAKRPNALAIQEFEWLVEQDLLKEEELCFSPYYFYHLKSVYKEITHIEIKWKQGVFINELTSYRYNVIIHVGVEEEMIEPHWQKWQDIADKQTVIDQLQQGTGTIALKEVPNPRLWQEQFLSKAQKDKSVSTVGDLVTIIDKEESESIQVKEILTIAQANGYTHRLLLDQNPFKVNVLMELKPSKSFIQHPYREKDYNPDILSTNIPLFSDINLLLQKDLRSILRSSLPEYMIPSELIALRKMPLTNNGKIDRKFLSQREERAVANKFNYEPPHTIIEHSLVKIWQELLGIDSIGINENFFELGGHSLLAMRVLAAIRQELKIDLRIKDLFQYTTIKDLSKYVDIQTNLYLKKEASEYNLLNI